MTCIFEGSRSHSWFTFNVDLFSDAFMLHVVVAKRGFWFELEW